MIKNNKYYRELKAQYNGKLFYLIGLYCFVIVTSYTIIIPLLLFIPIIMLHSGRSRLRLEMIKLEEEEKKE